MRFPGRLWMVALLLTVFGVALSAAAQGRGGGGAMGRSAGREAEPGATSAPPFENRRPSAPEPKDRESTSGDSGESNAARPAVQLGPPGRWWDDKSFAKSLKLRPDQKSRMDAIFEQNRAALLSRYQSLQQAQAQMEEIARSPNPDEGALFAGIDRVAQARAELEKTNAHILLQIRKEMDPDQIQRLANQH